MIVVCNIGRAGNGAAAVSQDDVDAARDEPADAALVVFAVDDDDGLRVVLHHVDQPALFLFAGIFIAQHQDGVVLLIGVLHQGAGDAGIEVVVELGDQKADLPLFLPAHMTRSQIRHIVERADSLAHTGGRFLGDGRSAVDDMGDCPDGDARAARDVLHAGSFILLFRVLSGHGCSISMKTF